MFRGRANCLTTVASIWFFLFIGVGKQILVLCFVLFHEGSVNQSHLFFLREPSSLLLYPFHELNSQIFFIIPFQTRRATMVRRGRYTLDTPQASSDRHLMLAKCWRVKKRSARRRVTVVRDTRQWTSRMSMIYDLWSMRGEVFQLVVSYSFFYCFTITCIYLSLLIPRDSEEDGAK